MEVLAAGYLFWGAVGVVSSAVAGGSALVYWYFKKRAKKDHEVAYDFVLEFSISELEKLAAEKAYLQGGRFSVGNSAGDSELLKERHHANVVALGRFNEGKTFLLSKLTGRADLPQGMNVSTKGLSFISSLVANQRKVLFVDTEGNDRIELLDSNLENSALLFEDLHIRKLTDTLIREVACQLSDVFLYVTSNSGASFLEDCIGIAKSAPRCQTVYVFHSYKHLNTKAAVHEYFTRHVRLPRLAEKEENGCKYYSNVASLPAAPGAPSRRLLLVHFCLGNDLVAETAAENVKAIGIFQNLLQEIHLAASQPGAVTIDEALASEKCLDVFRQYFKDVEEWQTLKK